MVQAGGCGGVTEIAESSPGRRGAALTGMPCEVHKWASIARLGGGAYARDPAVAAARHVEPKCGRDRHCQDWNC